MYTMNDATVSLARAIVFSNVVLEKQKISIESENFPVIEWFCFFRKSTRCDAASIETAFILISPENISEIQLSRSTTACDIFSHSALSATPSFPPAKSTSDACESFSRIEAREA